MSPWWPLAPEARWTAVSPLGLKISQEIGKPFAHLAFFNLTDRPWPISSSITSASAFSAAKWRAVFPLHPALSKAAPDCNMVWVFGQTKMLTCSKSLSTSRFPAPAARCRGLSPLLLAASKSAPASIRSRVTSTCPPRAAQCKGVLPLPSVSWGETPPCVRRNSTDSLRFCNAARWRIVSFRRPV